MFNLFEDALNRIVIIYFVEGKINFERVSEKNKGEERLKYSFFKGRRNIYQCSSCFVSFCFYFYKISFSRRKILNFENIS